MTSTRRLVTVALSVALLAACASTAQRRVVSDPLASDLGASGTGTGVGTGGGSAETDAQGGTAPPGPPTARITTETGETGAAPRASSAGGGVDSPAPPSGSPPRSGTLRIGIHVSKDLQAAYAAFGAKGAEGDLKPGLRAVVDWINANGGMGGRRVEAVFHESNPLDGSFDSEGQATCSDFADDKRVFAVVSGAVLPTIVTVDCLVKKQVPVVWNYHYVVDGPMWRQYLPYLYMPFTADADRLGFVIDLLAANGYFTPGARVALLRYDLPQDARLTTSVFRPRLAAHGVAVVDEIAIRPPASAAGAADTGAQLSNAILRLRAEGVTHVFFVPTGGVIPFVFMSEAEGQGYRPRYALTTLDIPAFVADQAPAGQLRGALAVGWSPPSDVRLSEAPPPTAPAALCYRLTNNSQTSQRFCDGLFFLKAALDRATTIDAAGLRAAVESMGDSFVPTFSIATRFGPGRHDGASAARLVAFDDACACFRYSGPVTPIG